VHCPPFVEIAAQLPVEMVFRGVSPAPIRGRWRRQSGCRPGAKSRLAASDSFRGLGSGEGFADGHGGAEGEQGGAAVDAGPGVEVGVSSCLRHGDNSEIDGGIVVRGNPVLQQTPVRAARPVPWLRSQIWSR